MKPKVYIETTVVSYLTARPGRDLITAAHQQLTQEWWENRRADFDLYASQLVIQESSAGDAIMAQKRLEILDEIPSLEVNLNAISLARVLLEQGPIPEKAAVDVLYIAVATVHGAAVAKICREAGYEPPIICTPEELLGS